MLPAGCTAQAPTPLGEAAKVPDISMALMMIKATPGTSTYLDDPNTVCTAFAPDNQVCGGIRRLHCLETVAGTTASTQHPSISLLGKI